MNFFLRLFTWWNSQTLGTQLFTARYGVKAGGDDAGNIYYNSRDGKRRWVIYKGECEASSVPPEWHGWLHHSWDTTPIQEPFSHKKWEKPHQENLTGTPAAYEPDGSLRKARPLVRADYEAWQPE